ncbi:MAG TPA: prepilin-type N-terminal cleavage/methylation domain-containing protein [Planctomycetes bacterium]|nr:prepilin-type N-terminal cleavage/methylation domain-containing protein [Planctomycetota bacterium]HIJ72008.1 prepilin-type N-terminal cleavage/methylation domain-containing protein [Planctomycetota bacterium]
MRHKAFTLIELLVVMTVVVLLAGILMPSLAATRQIGKRLVCLSNLRQMVIAANSYLANCNEYYPLASFVDKSQAGEGVQKNCEWDFCKVYRFGQMSECKPGALWQGETNLKIQQCPAFKGNANSPGDQFTGYNYNVSFIGGIMECAEDGRLTGTNSTRALEVRNPARCVIFGDGQYVDGANKFMRSPWLGTLETNDDLKLKPYGTQGFRHLGKTNVAYCDGRAETLAERYTETHEDLIDLIAENTGFLSPDNSSYDLK